MMHNMMKRALALVLTVVMVFGLAPAGVLAVQTGFTASPNASGTLTAVNPAEAISSNGPMSLTQSGSETVEVTHSGLLQSATEGELTKLEPQTDDLRAEMEAVQRYADDEKVTFIVVTENAPLLKKFSVSEIAAQTVSVNAHKATQENTLNAVKAEAQAALGADMKMGYTYTVGTTGFSVETAYGNLSKLQAMKGVKSVYVAPTFAIPEDMGEQALSPLTANSSTMIGADVLNESGFTGKGMRIAILDTGILESHPSFQAMSEDKLVDPMTRESVEEIWDTLNASQRTHMLNVSYKSNKIPFAFNYESGTFDVDNVYAGSDHGTHVAGISAANAVEGTTVKGMAPDAQLVVMQVFQSTGGANWATIMAALEDCVRLEVDAANLSLGAAAGFTDPDDAMLETMNLFLDSDVQVIIASGNDTNNAYMNLWGGDVSLITNPDTGLVGTPATYSAALTVASANNNGDMMLYFTLNGTEYGFSDTAATVETAFIQNFRNETLEYVMVPGIGAEEDYADIDVNGKVAVISRGTTSFPEKQATAQAHGAIAAIVYNNTAGLFLMQINDGNGAIPCVSVSKATGAALAAAEVKELTVCDADMKQFTSDTMMSDFSSWGVTPDLKLKPEITGVGGNIYSATHPSISGSYYGYMSGTSMATPQITGAMAVLLEYLEQAYPELTGTEQRVAAANILMSTASPIIHANGLEYSPRNQGAGLADLVNATTAGAYLSNPAASESRPKVEFGDDDAKNGVYNFSFEITNMDAEPKTYQFSSSLLSETIVSDWFIGAEPYGLEAKVTVGSDSVGKVLCCDFNEDGVITTADARIVLQFVAGTLKIAEDNAHYAYLDVNADGTVDAADAKVITDYCAELEVAVDLTASIEVPVNQITVPAGETVSLTGEIVLTAADKEYLDQFPNGIFVEGYLYATEVGLDTENAAANRLTMPIVGYYGDWSDPEVFDRDDLGSYSLYPNLVYTWYSELGYNPYFRSGRSGDEFNYLSYANPLDVWYFGQLRNAKAMTFTVTNAETGEVYHTLEASYLTKTHYNASYGMIIPTYLEAGYGELWDGKTADGKNLPDGTTVIYSAEAWLDDGDDIADDTMSFRLTLDNTSPEILNAGSLQESLVFEGERTYLKLDVLENEKLAAIIFLSNDGRVMGKYELENVPGETLSHTFDITGFGNSFSIVAADFACNETEIEAFLNLGEQNNARPEPQELDSSRLYGCETFDSAAVEPGWFSAEKSDFSGYRNETYDSTNRYYSAEFVNGYLIAQNANTGHIELVTPSGSYWSSQVLVENRGGIGDPGVFVLYDMALDHSGTLSSSYGFYGTNATDSLLAVGWYYQGDNDNNGKDDGYNALFNIKFTDYGTVEVQPIARTTGLSEGAELLTLGITTEGDIYGIGTDGILYSVAKEATWDDNAGEWGDYVVVCTEIAATDFVNYPSYAGVNVIQSMGYDHNTGTMYWYAHTQVPVSYYYDNVNVTYKVDLETGKCEEVGSYGPGGLTCLFVPNDLTSDLFEMGVQATNMAIAPQTMELVEGQTKRLGISWTPWNAEPVDVTWASDNADVAVVDEYGFVTAKTSGTVTISASAEMMLDGYWEVTDAGDWVWHDPGMGTKTVSCTINIVPSEDALYGFIASNEGDTDNNSIWVTYSDKNPRNISTIGKFQLNGEDAFWNGGTYYNGYVYATYSTSFIQDDVIYNGTELYRMKVTEGETPAETIIGEPERIGFAQDMEITALAFDYNTGRMYCVENKYIGGLGIIDLDTGVVDMLGQPTGDLYGGVYIPALCVTGDGILVISDAVGNLYTMDPDTLQTKYLYYGSGDPYTAFYEAMCYDYNTGSIYWNPCEGAGNSPLYLVRMPANEWDMATVVDMGDVATKYGTQQTVLFAIPENEPETKHIPVESIEILNGETLTGLEGGSLKLDVATTPARPTVQTKTWTSSNESVVSVDRYGTMTYHAVGTATITVSITNKDEEAHGGPFTDSIEITVMEAAGDFVAFLNSDENGSQYYDFWLNGKDYDLRHTTVGESMIATYSLRTGAYYDGYFYAFNDKGQFMRINAKVPSDYKILGTAELDITKYQVTGMAMDYATGTMYGLTLPSDYDFANWAEEQHPGELVKIDLDTGALTTVAVMDFSTPVFALACDKNGTLYAAGGSFDMYATTSTIYTVDKATGELTPYVTIDGGIYTGSNYYGSMQYNTQMTYDFGTDRLYLNVTADDQYYSHSYGVHMVQLGEEPVASYLDGISLDFGRGSIKYGDVYLGLLAFIPETDEVPVGAVNGILMNKTAGRVAVGGTAQIVASVRPSNAADPSLTWTSSDETIATVDGSGLVTGITAGEVVITVKSNETGIEATCAMTVVELTGKQSTAYTVSAKMDSLISFNPALPAQTAEVVTTMSGGSTIKALTAGDGCIYFITDSNYAYYLYRYDILTQQTVSMGQLYLFSEPTGLAYDPENNLIYATAGFYLFQFQVDALDPSGFNYYSNYMMDSDYCTLAGVTCIDGAVYTVGNEYYNAIPQMMKYSDKYLSDRSVFLKGFDLSLVDGATDFSYDPASGLFYFTDAGHNIFTMDMSGNVEAVDILGSGIDMNGLAIIPAAE